MWTKINPEKLSQIILDVLVETEQSATDLAMASGVSQQTISSLILQRHRSVRPATLRALQETIGFELGDVIV